MNILGPFRRSIRKFTRPNFSCVWEWRAWERRVRILGRRKLHWIQRTFSQSGLIFIYKVRPIWTFPISFSYFIILEVGAIRHFFHIIAIINPILLILIRLISKRLTICFFINGEALTRIIKSRNSGLMRIFLYLNFVVKIPWLLMIPITFITVVELGFIYNFGCVLILMINIWLFDVLILECVLMNPIFIINTIFFMCVPIIILDICCGFSKSMI